MAWILSVLCVFSLAFAGPARSPSAKIVPFPAPLVLTASDGTTLHAAWGGPAKAENGVVFVHAAGGAKEDWAALADKCARAGMMVVAVDLRGHGANVSGAPPALTPADYVAMEKDVAAASAHLRAGGVRRIAMVGAELGANLALNAAAEDDTVVSVVLLSPGLDYKGVITPDAIRRYGARAALFVASQDDAYGARSAAALDAAATGDHRVELLTNAGKGMRMFNHEPGLESVILGFLNAHWVGTAGASGAPASAPNSSAAPAPPGAPSPATTPPRR
jgi:alpha-beta hydrolase superfamily lysophospholipase